MTMKFPFVENTLGKKLEAGTGLSVDCLTCKRKAALDVAELVKRLGPDEGCMHWDIMLWILYVPGEADLLPRVQGSRPR